MSKDEEEQTQILTPDTIDVPLKAEWYTPQEVGKLFRVDPKTVVRWETSGLLEKHDVRVARTPGNHRRYHRDDINRLFYELNKNLGKRNGR